MCAKLIPSIVDAPADAVNFYPIKIKYLGVQLYLTAVHARNGLWVLLVLCSCALFAYSSLRAYRLSFTHDESLSYRIVLGELFWKEAANHHPLNTNFMGWMSHWLGSREWQLRLPNVIAHILYLVFGLLVLAQLKQTTSVLLGFALLNFNPFLLDFFGLARGYGLALGLSMTALFLLWQAWVQENLVGKTALLLLSLACASLADLANFTWLNFHLPLVAGSLIVLFVGTRFPTKVNRATLLCAAVITGTNAWFIRNLARRIWALGEHGQLYARGKNGFVSDTLGSLIDSYFYMQPYPSALKPAIILVSIVGFLLVAAVVGYRTWSDHHLSFPAVLLVILALAVAAPIVEHLFLGIEYPVERIALYYVPIAALLTVFAIDEAIVTSGSTFRLAGGVCCAMLITVMLFHLYRTVNLHHTMTWFYDANTKAAALEVERLFGGSSKERKINLGNDWIFEPSLNYYRVTRHYDWLNPVTRNRLKEDDNDVIYTYAGDLENHAKTYTVIQTYPETGTVLVKVERELNK